MAASNSPAGSATPFSRSQHNQASFYNPTRHVEPSYSLGPQHPSVYAPPAVPYAQQQYNQQHFGENQYAQAPFGQAQGSQREYYPQARDELSPHKRLRGLNPSSGYPPPQGYPIPPPPLPSNPYPQPIYSYPQPTYQPLPAPAPAFPPPPPPGWFAPPPPPPPGWKTAPPQPYPQATTYQHPKYHQVRTPFVPPVPPPQPQWSRPSAPRPPQLPATPVQTDASHSTPGSASREPRHFVGKSASLAGPQSHSSRSARPGRASSESAAVKDVAEYDNDSDFWFLDNDEGFWGEGDEVDSNLNLGEVVWHPAESVRHAMPVNYAVVEERVRKRHKFTPAKENKASISKYATEADLEEQCLPVRNIHDWSFIKSDPVFADLSNDEHFSPIAEVIANRGRPAIALHDMEAGEEGEIEDMDVEMPLAPWNIRLSEGIQDEDSMVEEESPQAAEEPVVDSVSPAPYGVDDDDDEPYSPPAALNIMHEARTEPMLDAVIKQELTEPISMVVSPTEQSLHEVGKENLEAHNDHKSGQTQAGQIQQTTLDRKISEGTEQQVEAEPAKNDRQVVVNGNTSPDVGYSIQEDMPLVKQVSFPEPRYLGRPEPMPQNFVKDNVQEDILASLGVTGSPKPVFAMPAPAFISLSENSPTEISQSVPAPISEHNYSVIGTQILGLPPYPNRPIIPPPPPPPKLPRLSVDESDISPWKTSYGRDGSKDSPKSEASQGTLAGSDFHREDTAEPLEQNNEKLVNNEPPPPPPVEPATPSKRSRSGSTEFDEEVKRQRGDGPASRLRKRQPKVASAYGRRW